MKRPKTPRQTLALYWRATLGFRGWLAMHIVTVAAAVMAQSILSPYLVSQGINLLSTTVHRSQVSFWATFGVIICWYLAAQVISWTSWRLSGWAVVKFEIGVMAKLDQLSFEHLAGLSYRFYTSAFTGSLVNQSNRLARSFERLYDVLAFDILTLFLKVGFTSTILFTIQPMIAVALLVFFALYAVAAVALALWKMPASAAAAAASSRQTGQLADKLTNISAIKYFAREPDEIASYRQTVASTKQAFTRDWVTQEIINAVQAILLIAFSAGFFIGSLFLVSQGQINFGQFILIQSYVMVIFDALWGLAGSPAISNARSPMPPK
ncbi:ABC transporter ATP-binding protein [bacterium]|nr:MAG: ABC transporter ATP-binding protein [bacterium]